MSDFFEETIRQPDKIRREQLLSGQDEIQRALEESMQTYYEEELLSNKVDVKVENQEELEALIHQSILDQIEECEKKRKEVGEERRKVCASLLIRLKWMIQKNSTLYDQLLSIFERFFGGEEFVEVSKEEYILFQNFLHFIYTIPNHQKRKPLISYDLYELLVRVIICKEDIRDITLFADSDLEQLFM